MARIGTSRWHGVPSSHAEKAAPRTAGPPGRRRQNSVHAARNAARWQIRSPAHARGDPDGTVRDIAAPGKASTPLIPGSARLQAGAAIAPPRAPAIAADELSVFGVGASSWQPG